MKAGQFTARAIDWQPLRDAFVQRSNRPTYEELATEFAVSPISIGRCAQDEGWTALRARYLEAQLQAADASSVLLTAVRGDRTVATAYLSLAVVTLATLQGIVENVRASDKADSTKSDTINNCTFAAKNMAEALKTVGIVGITKLLGEGKEGNGQWNPEMLASLNQQINVTIQQASAGQASVAPSVPVDISDKIPDTNLPGKKEGGTSQVSP